MAYVRVVSTEVVPARERFAFWRESIQQHDHLAKSRFTLHYGPAFHGFLESGELGRFQLGRFNVGAHTVERVGPRVWQRHTDVPLIAFQVKGQAYFEEDDSRVSLSPGEWSLIGVRPWTKVVFVTNEVEQLYLTVPWAQLEGIGVPDRFGARTFSSRKGLAKLLYELLSATSKELPGLSEQSAHCVAASIGEMVNYSLLEILGDRPAVSFKEALHSRACAYILQNLRDPTLNVGQVAGAMRCSKRYLHLVFAGKGNTIEELIWKRRLDGCKSDLQNPALGRRSMTDIAFSWGFNNYTHFSRKFKDAFGASPRDLRASAR